MPRRWAPQLLTLALILCLGATLVYPIALTIRGAFAADPQSGSGFTLDHLRLVFVDPVQRGSLMTSFALAVATTTLAIILALPLAILAATYRYPLKGALGAIILVPLILPPFVGAIGMQAILGREGALNSLLGTSWDVLAAGKFWGVAGVEALHLYPIIYLNATAALANLDPALDEAAENLGAGFWRRLLRITLPLIRPGLFAGATVVFIWSFTELGTPLVFDYRSVTPVQVFNGLKEIESSAQPYALTLVMLAAALGIYVVGRVLFGRRAHAMYSKASRASAEKPLAGIRAIAATVAFASVIFLALVPHLGVVLTAFACPGSWYATVLPSDWTLANFEQALGHPEAFGSIKNSLKLASLATVIDLFIGVLVAYLVVRTRARGRHVLDGLCMLPLAVPGLVLAFGYVAVTLRWPFGGNLPQWSITFLDVFLPSAWVQSLATAPLKGTVSIFGATPNPVPLLVLAYAVRRLPYIVRAASAGLEQTSGELEEAAMNLGASRIYAVRRVILPLIAANLIAGALLAFSFAMLEVSDSMILAQQQAQFPITKAIYMFLNRMGDGPFIASAMGVWGMALLTVTLVGASVMIGKKLGSIFRV
ncbi:MAG: iron ABC transporter permease [Phycisphaerales bacterium]|nr:iron ABC transporter permease [Phycisphaerales bacterium]